MALEFEKTALWADVRKVFKEPSKPIRHRFEIVIHTEKEDIPVMQMTNLDIVRDYANNIGDEVHIDLVVPLGDYVKRVFPYRTNLELSVKKKILSEAGNRVDTKQPPIVERYKAVFLPNANMNPKTSEYDQIDKQTLDRMDVLNVKLQLLDRALEPLRIKSVNGVYQNVSVKDLIHALLGGESAKVKVDGKNAISGLDLVEPDNKEKKKQIVFPTRTLVTGIPTFLQEKFNGVYGTGIGTYLQVYDKKKLWFIYPLFNTKRFDSEKKPKAIFYMVPENRFPGVERTYRQVADVTHVLITGAKSYQDGGETDQMDSGNGFRMSEARSFMKKPVVMTKDGPVASRTQLNHEVIANSRKDGLNYAPLTDNAISSNPFVEYSRLAKSLVARVDFVWENSNPELLYPGMPCKYIFLENDIVREVKGTVVFAHTVVSQSTVGVTMTGHSTRTVVTILTEKIGQTSKQEKAAPPPKSGSPAKSKANKSKQKVPAKNRFAKKRK